MEGKITVGKKPGVKLTVTRLDSTVAVSVVTIYSFLNPSLSLSSTFELGMSSCVRKVNVGNKFLIDKTSLSLHNRQVIYDLWGLKADSIVWAHRS